MGFFDFLRKWAAWHQKSANSIKSWSLPSDVEKLFDEVWSLCDDSIKKQLLNLLEKYYIQFGPEAFKKILEALKKVFK